MSYPDLKLLVAVIQYNGEVKLRDASYKEAVIDVTDSMQKYTFVIHIVGEATLGALYNLPITFSS